ncbi:MAG: hypothetical protein JST36_07565 [Bacteroidetes bacterium]|nr:hypothetical protein [Bacteroidota bacterium]
MNTIVLKINRRTRAGKALEAVLDVLTEQPGVEIVSDKSPYNARFINKVKRAQAEIKAGKSVTLNTKDVWGSLGL